MMGLTRTMTQEKAIENLQDKLGHRFTDRSLLLRALTHPSLLVDKQANIESNQRLEFLGDAVLQFALTQALYRAFPLEREGQLTSRRSQLTRGKSLAELGRRIGLPDALLMGASELQGGGQNRDAALEDAFEALLGALYLEVGIERATTVVLSLFGDLNSAGEALAHDDDDPYAPRKNPKGQLQERVQPVLGNDALCYELVAVTGEDHNRRYEMCVKLAGLVLGTGSGSSKQAAGVEAARSALRHIDAEGLPKI